MKNLIVPFVVLMVALTGLGAVLLLPGNPTAPVPETAKAQPSAIAAELPPEPASGSAGLPYQPPDPEPNIDRARLTAESHALMNAVPADIRDNLIVEEPELDDEDAQRVAGMAWIPGGVFVMGNNHGPPDEAPRHAVALDGFWMDITEVTNRRFAEFVESTGYVTLPERTPELRSIRPGSPVEQAAVLEEMNQPGSICSLNLNSRDDIDPMKGAYSWWQYVPGASWRHPEGPDSSIDDRMDHPVVHVSWLDVQEYCGWARRSLPTEAQWEYAARGGHDGRVYPWGNTRQPDGTWLQNIWQGEFPIADTGDDGFTATAPVGSFPPNDYGLHDMSGNVWEWCMDYYRPDYYRTSAVLNPTGPTDSFDPQEPDFIKRVQRGGSFMCSDQYCIGYRVASRMKGEFDTGAFHTGFRTIITPEMLNSAADE